MAKYRQIIKDLFFMVFVLVLTYFLSYYVQFVFDTDTLVPTLFVLGVFFVSLRTEGYVWGVIRTAMASVSDLCVVPMQDFLGLGEEGRMNFPGTMSDANWTWRAKPGYLTDALAQRIARLTKLYGR